jgi:hypothetical protein
MRVPIHSEKVLERKIPLPRETISSGSGDNSNCR